MLGFIISGINKLWFPRSVGKTVELINSVDQSTTVH